jgi:hypothetical protein
LSLLSTNYIAIIFTELTQEVNSFTLSAEIMASKKRKLNDQVAAADGAVADAPQKHIFLVCGTYDEGFEQSFSLLLRAESRIRVAQWMLDNYETNETVKILLRSMAGFIDRSEENDEDEEPILARQRFTAEQLLDLIDNSYVDGDSDMGVKICQYEEPQEI